MKKAKKVEVTTEKKVAVKKMAKLRKRMTEKIHLYKTVVKIGGLYESSGMPQPSFTVEYVSGVERLWAAAGGGDVYKIPGEARALNERAFCEVICTKGKNCMYLKTYCRHDQKKQAQVVLCAAIKAKMNYAIEIANRTINWSDSVIIK